MDAVPDDTKFDTEMQDALIVRKGICHLCCLEALLTMQRPINKMEAERKE
jgi:hypothetical protein